MARQQLKRASKARLKLKRASKARLQLKRASKARQSPKLAKLRTREDVDEVVAEATTFDEKES